MAALTPLDLGMIYDVTFIEDDGLPCGTDWALVREGKATHFIVKRSRVSAAVLEKAWMAYRSLDG